MGRKRSREQRQRQDADAKSQHPPQQKQPKQQKQRTQQPQPQPQPQPQHKNPQPQTLQKPRQESEPHQPPPQPKAHASTPGPVPAGAALADSESRQARARQAGAQSAKRLDAADYLHHRRGLPSDGVRDAMRVTRRAHRASMVRRVEKRLDCAAAGASVTLAAAGAAIECACDVALAVGMSHGGRDAVQLDVTTTSVKAVDDFEALDEDASDQRRDRFVSGVRICIRRTDKWL